MTPPDFREEARAARDEIASLYGDSYREGVAELIAALAVAAYERGVEEAAYNVEGLEIDGDPTIPKLIAKAIRALRAGGGEGEEERKE